MKDSVLILTFFVFILLIFSCKKDEPLPENPYDKVIYDDGGVMYADTIYPYSIVSIHKNILSLKCAYSNCHGGSFLPDFRSVQSAYATLVYQQVNKSTLDSNRIFKYRVLPFDTAYSFLHERLVTPTPEYMPSNGIRLSKDEIDRIDRWILEGAKDMFGQLPQYPNTEPSVLYYIAFDTFPPGNELSKPTNRIDSIFYNPFIVNANSNLVLLLGVQDDSTAIKDMQVNMMKMSLDKNDFSNAKTYTATYLDLGGLGFGEWWQVTMNTGDFPSDTTVYMRYYVNDGNNPTVEMPYNSLPDPYKIFWSFYIKP